jgi:hypothetical protein
MYRPTSSKQLYAYLLALLALVAQPCLAQADVVYRFDTRPPEQIFAEGFAPRGSDLSLVDHWRYSSSARSGFVGTTDRHSIALEFAEAYFQRTGTRRGFVYRISANQHFYSVALSAEDLLQRMRAAGAQTSHRRFAQTLRDGLEAFGWEREYVSDRAIPGTMIAAATEVTGTSLAGGRMRIDETEPQDNPHFVITGTHANTGPYPMTWPATDYPSSSSETEASSDDEDDGAVGPPLAGDVLAVAGPSGYMHPGVFPGCDASPHKRSIGSNHCPKLSSMVNVSKLRRITLSLLAEDGPFPRYGHDEL